MRNRQARPKRREVSSFNSKEKWYWCISTWLADVTVQNAWLLDKKSGGSLRQFEFKEYIAQSYITRYAISPKGPGRPKSGSSTNVTRVLDDVRYIGIDHYLVETPEKKRCPGDGCKKVPSSQCSKCDVGLCVTCNIGFHTNKTI